MAASNSRTQIVILIALYLLLCPLWSWPLYERMLFFSAQKGHSETAKTRVQQIVIRDHIQWRDVIFQKPDGTRLHGWFFQVPQPKKVVLLSHGNGGNMEHRLVLAEALLLCEMSVFLYDYEGYGDSQGSPSLVGAREDILAAFDYLTNQEKILPKDILAYGESFGSGVSCYLSTQRPVSRVILQSAYPSLVYAAHDRLWFTWLYPDCWFPDLNNISMLKGHHPPVLIVQGDQDAYFPQQYSHVLFKHASEPKQLSVISDMGHCLEQADDHQFLVAINQFISH